MGGWWTVFASIQASLCFGFILTFVILYKGISGSRDSTAIRAQRGGGLFALCTSFYTFSVLVFSQIIVNGPDLSILIRDGFGSDRVAWLMMAVVLEQAIRMLDMVLKH